MKVNRSYRVSIIQNMPLFEIEQSIENSLQLIKKAAAHAELIILPEMFITPYEFALMPKAAAFSEYTLLMLADIARETNTFICAGSIPVHLPHKAKLTNTSFLLDTSGRIIASYNKCHLFDVSLPEITVCESKVFSPGNDVSVTDTALGKIGVAICYDIRFPELCRKLALLGMQLLCVPAAFSQTTGSAHWHTVMRARAIENQVYLCAASPARNPDSSYPAYGHSMIVSPWGEIVAEAGIDEQIITAEINMSYLEKVRRQLPLLKHRRPELY